MFGNSSPRRRGPTWFAAVILVAACGTSSTPGPLDGVSEVVFLQRQLRAASGDVYQSGAYMPGARLVSLRPPTADGTLTVLCCDRQGPDFAAVDIDSYDISYDATEIVFSARLSADQRYGLFLLTLSDGSVDQLPTDPNRDYFAPVFLAGNSIAFVANAAAAGGVPHRDEYSRAVATQLGVINRDGSGEKLAGPSLSHRVGPTALSDGRVMFSQWDHLGAANSGSLMVANADLSGIAEAFGKEGQGFSDAYLAPVEIAPGRILAVATSRTRTLQAGSLVEIFLGEPYQDGDILRADVDMSEANSSHRVITDRVPLGRQASWATIGRYHDGYPLDGSVAPDLLVSWADGPVYSETLEEGGVPANFGIYVFDQENRERRPIWDDKDYWDIHPRPLAARVAPAASTPIPAHPWGEGSVLIGSMNVYESSLFEFAANSVYGVRVIEGFNVEEGFSSTFGTTLHEGAARLGVAPIHEEDGSWAALIPAGVPVQLQPIDRFGMALATAPVWVGGSAGETRFCAGCHADRTAPLVINPSATAALATGPVDLFSTIARTDRQSMNFNRDSVVGVPWPVALQPIFDAKCISCHSGSDNSTNTSLVIDTAVGSQSLVFDLRGAEVDPGGIEVVSGYSASYLSLIGVDDVNVDDDVTVTGDLTAAILPQNARGSRLIQILNPIQQYPTVDDSVRAFTTTPHGVDMGFTLTSEEHLLFILMVDMGGQFYSRENAPGGY